MTGPELTKIVIMRNSLSANSGCKTVLNNYAHESALSYDELKRRLITAQDRNTIMVKPVASQPAGGDRLVAGAAGAAGAGAPRKTKRNTKPQATEKKKADAGAAAATPPPPIKTGTFKCHSCGQVGHKKFECPSRSRGNGATGTVNAASAASSAASCTRCDGTGHVSTLCP
jgi:hypothetical protein